MAVNIEKSNLNPVAYSHDNKFGHGLRGANTTGLTRTTGDIHQIIKPPPKVVERVVEKVVHIEKPVERVVQASHPAPVQYVDKVVVEDRVVNTMSAEDRAILAECLSKAALLTMENNRLRFLIAQKEAKLGHVRPQNFGQSN